jgi:hypothetical protein
MGYGVKLSVSGKTDDATLLKLIGKKRWALSPSMIVTLKGTGEADCGSALCNASTPAMHQIVFPVSYWSRNLSIAVIVKCKVEVTVFEYNATIDYSAQLRFQYKLVLVV